MSRWWTFLSERFPLPSHLLMILSFALANGMLGAIIYGPLTYAWDRSLIAFVVAFSFFLRLRLFDEIKDYETDLKVNPTRPLARGLIKIPEVKVAIGALCALEFGLLAYLGSFLVASHALAVLYSFLMYAEFFVGRYIRIHLTTYAVMHTLGSVFVGASVLSVVSAVPFWGFTSTVWLLLATNWAYFNLFEFARKTFAQQEEREGVDSYSKVFSIPGAVILSLSQAVLPLLVYRIVFESQMTKADQILLGGLLVLVLGPAFSFILRKRVYGAKMFRAMVGVYLIAAYLSLAWVLRSWELS